MPDTGLRKLAAFVALAMILTASWNAMGARADRPAPGTGIVSQ